MYNLVIESVYKIDMNIKSLETRLKKQAVHDPAYKAFREKTTKLPVIGLRLPVLNAFAKSLDATTEELDELWHTSTFHESKTIALLALIRQKRVLGKKEWAVLKRWVEHIDNWEHSDNLSALYSLLVEHHPDWILPTLRAWNKSTNPWKQRASIVPLIFYASPKRKAPKADLVFNMVKPLLHAKDPYVQKGVGWTLRECYKLYPNETYQFLIEHVCDLSATSYSYATEKVTKKEKGVLKRIRTNR